MYIKIDNTDDLVKDESGAVLNVNKEGLRAYRAKRALKLKALEDQKKIQTLEAEVSELKNYLRQIMEVLQERGLR